MAKYEFHCYILVKSCVDVNGSLSSSALDTKGKFYPRHTEQVGVVSSSNTHHALRTASLTEIKNMNIITDTLVSPKSILFQISTKGTLIKIVRRAKIAKKNIYY